jgi:hypothetical protein
MKTMKWVFLTWVASLAVLFLLDNVPATHTHSFCAYNRVFVEFEENGTKWGTIMLDYNGKPIPCNENDEEPVAIPNHIGTKERKLHDQSI